MRKAKWFVSVQTAGASGSCGVDFADSKLKDGWTRREVPSEGCDAEKALFKCRAADFEKRVSYLRWLVDLAEFSDENRERMLKAVDLLEKAKQTMASVIEDEVGSDPH